MFSSPRRVIALAACLLASTVQAATPASDRLALRIPPADQVLKTLKPDHPRLLADAQRFARLRQQAMADPLLKAWCGKVHTSAERILTQKPSEYEIPDGLRLLATSRRVLDRILTLGVAYRLSGDERFVGRAWAELAAAAAFKDWNPRHFLDTAEMTAAFGIGYDWFFDAWTEDQRAQLRRARTRSLGMCNLWASNTPPPERSSPRARLGPWMSLLPAHVPSQHLVHVMDGDEGRRIDPL